MNQEQILVKFIGRMKQQQAELAEASMLRPKHELFGLGEAAGKYQGMQNALDILDDIIRDKDEKERTA